MNVIDHIVNDSSTHVSFSKRFVDLVIFNQNIKKTNFSVVIHAGLLQSFCPLKGVLCKNYVLIAFLLPMSEPLVKKLKNK